MRSALSKFAVVCLIGIVIIIGLNAYAAFNKQYVMAARGNVKSIKIGVYWDSALTNQTTNINWGVLEPDENKTYTLYLQNQANTPATFSMWTDNWNPTNASNYINLTWDCTTDSIPVDAVIMVHFTLHVASNVSEMIVTAFTFDVIVQASG